MTFEATQCGMAVAKLTDREKECLRGLASGRPRKQIASEMGIHPQTFSKHLASVYAKLGINSEVEAVRVAVAANCV
jgi:DNA-binding CsgD family transcriptional regulator